MTCDACDGHGCVCMAWRDWWSMEWCERGPCPECGVRCESLPRAQELSYEVLDYSGRVVGAR